MNIHFSTQGVLIIHPLLLTRSVSHYYLPLLFLFYKSQHQNNQVAHFSTNWLSPADTFQVSNFINADGHIPIQKIKPVTTCVDLNSHYWYQVCNDQRATALKMPDRNASSTLQAMLMKTNQSEVYYPLLWQNEKYTHFVPGRERQGKPLIGSYPLLHHHSMCNQRQFWFAVQVRNCSFKGPDL